MSRNDLSDFDAEKMRRVQDLFSAFGYELGRASSLTKEAIKGLRQGIVAYKRDELRFALSWLPEKVAAWIAEHWPERFL